MRLESSAALPEWNDAASRFVQLRPQILRYLLSRVRDHHVAEDLTQETLVRGILCASTLREPQAAVAWILRIAWNVALDWHRHRLRRPEGVTSDGEIDPLGDAHQPVGVDVDEEQRIRELWRGRTRQALAQLAALDRVLVIGHYFVGLSCAELATRTGLTRNGVKTRLSRARRRLRDALPERRPLRLLRPHLPRLPQDGDARATG